MQHPHLGEALKQVSIEQWPITILIFCLNLPGPNRTRLKQLQGRVNRVGGVGGTGLRSHTTKKLLIATIAQLFMLYLE